ncbi:hypothetical protein PACTADRAFT_47392 [Pachysolen tannophilus NRRL Y-2460]|uniref:Uncharacterized protein n=1 Tax=Pachysolen tannophilus NRRL Y-2460 TaxID=669874 RepID=A0A1E4U0G0_PACTA|nr:hypothetical protein PACTADRAFT_47392 [Pachysolen tannophilus NRRL Y-2460]
MGVCLSCLRPSVDDEINEEHQNETTPLLPDQHQQYLKEQYEEELYQENRRRELENIINATTNGLIDVSLSQPSLPLNSANIINNSLQSLNSINNNNNSSGGNITSFPKVVKVIKDESELEDESTLEQLGINDITIKDNLEKINYNGELFYAKMEVVKI